MRGLARDQDEDEEGEHSQQAADDDGQRANVDGLEDAEEDLENIPAGVNVAEEEEEDSSLCGAHGPVCGPGKLCGSKHELDEGSMLWPTIAFGAVLGLVLIPFGAALDALLSNSDPDTGAPHFHMACCAVVWAVCWPCLMAQEYISTRKREYLHIFTVGIYCFFFLFCQFYAFDLATSNKQANEISRQIKNTFESPFNWDDHDESPYDTRHATTWQDIASIDDIWYWIKGPFVDNIITEDRPSSCGYGICAMDKKWSIVGAIKMRQLRVKPPACWIVPAPPPVPPPKQAPGNSTNSTSSTNSSLSGAAISNGGPKGGRRLLQKKQASTEAKESCEFGFTDSGEGPDWWCADSTIDGVVYTGAVHRQPPGGGGLGKAPPDIPADHEVPAGSGPMYCKKTGPEYSLEDQETRSFMPGWKLSQSSNEGAAAKRVLYEWTYTNGEYVTLAGRNVTAMSFRSGGANPTWYPGGGYTDLTQPANATKYKEHLAKMQADDWIDTNTRILIVELLIFIDDTNYWAMTTFLIQLKANGAVVPDQMKVQLGRIPTWYTGGRYCCGYEGNYKVYGLFVFFVYFAVRETRSCMRRGFYKYIQNKWRLFDSVNYVMLLINIIFNWVAEYYWPGDPSLNAEVFALNIILAFLHLLEYVSFDPRLYRIVNTFSRCWSDLIVFNGIFLVLIIGFAEAFMLVFSLSDDNFGSLTESIFSLCRGIIGDLDAGALLEADYTSGVLFFLLYVSVVMFTLLTVLIAIISEAYDAVQEDAPPTFRQIFGTDWQDLERREAEAELKAKLEAAEAVEAEAARGARLRRASIAFRGQVGGVEAFRDQAVRDKSVGGQAAGGLQSLVSSSKVAPAPDIEEEQSAAVAPEGADILPPSSVVFGSFPDSVETFTEPTDSAVGVNPLDGAADSVEMFTQPTESAVRVPPLPVAAAGQGGGSSGGELAQVLEQLRALTNEVRELKAAQLAV